MRTGILCPECFKEFLLAKEGTDMHCDKCGTDFIRIGKNGVKYK